MLQSVGGSSWPWRCNPKPNRWSMKMSRTVYWQILRSEEVGQSCESIKWTGVVDHVLAKWPPYVGLQSSQITIQTVVFFCSKSDVQNTVCACGLLDVPLHDVARLLAVDAIDVVKSHKSQRCKQVRAVSPSGVLI